MLKPTGELPITRSMSIDSVLQRVALIEQAASDPALLAARAGGALAPSTTTGAPSTATDAPSAATPASASPSPASPSFAQALQSASATYPTLGVPGSSTPSGARIVAAAESQLGQTEQPPGSNESPAIAQYRSAVAGAMPGEPWCAYFASWAARQAGEPLGAHGEGLGAVSQIWSWAQSTGRAVTNVPGVVPQPGDLIVFGDEHVGIVRGVLPNGDIQTIEGNYENKVSLNVRPPGEATGYVSMS